MNSSSMRERRRRKKRMTDWCLSSSRLPNTSSRLPYAQADHMVTTILEGSSNENCVFEANIFFLKQTSFFF